MTDYRIRLSIEETLRVETEAARTGRPVTEIVSGLASRAAMTLPAPARHLRAKETQSEKRARLRAADPDGMSPYTRELQTIRPTTKEHHA